MTTTVSAPDIKCNIYGTLDCGLSTEPMRCHNFKSGTTVVCEPARYSTRSGSTQTDGRRKATRRLIGSLRPFAEFAYIFRGLSSNCAILRMAATSTRCEWTLFTQNSVDWRSHGRWHFRRPQKMQICKGYSRYPAISLSSLLWRQILGRTIGDIFKVLYLRPDKLTAG
jgi:hypothetical protein